MAAKRPRVLCYAQDSEDRDRISRRLEDIKRTLPPNSSMRDVFLLLLDFYEEKSGSPTYTRLQQDQNRQITVPNPDLDNQLFLCEQQQLEVLVSESASLCIKCKAVSWKLKDCIMRGHALAGNIVCSKCQRTRRWLSSSIIGDRYAVNARLVELIHL